MPSEAGQLQLLDNGLFANIAIIAADYSQPDSRAHSRNREEIPAAPARPDLSATRHLQKPGAPPSLTRAAWLSLPEGYRESKIKRWYEPGLATVG